TQKNILCFHGNDKHVSMRPQRKTRPVTTIRFQKTREELELDRDRCRRRPGDLDLRRTGDIRHMHAYRLLMRGGVRRHIGGGGGILRGGENLRGGGRTVGASTAVTVISCPHNFRHPRSTVPPSMCFRAFSASSGVSNST
uniref:Uncharacterized protein n=1 Tax=Labrus bergylta TaxID=56723 RepID=A0A3Q3FLZ9_9LABR